VAEHRSHQARYAVSAAGIEAPFLMGFDRFVGKHWLRQWIHFDTPHMDGKWHAEPNPSVRLSSLRMRGVKAGDCLLAHTCRLARQRGARLQVRARCVRQFVRWSTD